MNDNGYAAQGEHGYFGKLLSLGFIDETRDSIRLGLKPASMALDETHARLAIASEQQATVFWYDMNTLKPDATSELAFHFDDLALSPDGQTLYLANHLGKSQRLLLYSFVGQEIVDIPTGTWTTTFAVDSARSRIFALSHQENAIYILSTFSHSIIGKTPIFGYKEQRGDALSTMLLDKARQKMYVAMPEHKSIAVLDLGSSATEKSLKIWGYTAGAGESGVGKIQIALAPDVNKLYVLRTTQKRLNVYNLNTSVLIDSLNLAPHWTPPMSLWAENLLAYDAVAKRIYVGAIAVDCNTNRISSHSLPTAARFLGYNSKETILYSITQAGATLIAQEHDPQTLAITASRVLYNTSEPISPLVYLDSRRNQLHLLDRLEGVLHRFDVKNLVGAAAANNDAEAAVTLTVFPNPVNSQATVRFGVKRREKVRLAVYDNIGREVSILTDGEYEPGTHTITLKIESAAYTTQNYTLQLKSPSMSYTKAIQVQR
jgi:DNA-binding beta-propeller fold protein YncE